MSRERSLWCLVVAAILHVAEERLLDLPSWALATSGLTLPWSTFYLVNAAFLVFAAAAAAVGWRAPIVSLSFPALTSINALFFHIGPTVVTGRLSPGTISSVFLYVPLAIWIYVRAHRRGVLTPVVVVLSTALGAGIMALPFLVVAAGAVLR